jgi:hypothetical protein
MLEYNVRDKNNYYNSGFRIEIVIATHSYL